MDLAEVYELGKLNTPINLKKALEFYKQTLNAKGIKYSYVVNTPGRKLYYTLKEGDIPPANAQSIAAYVENRIRNIEAKLKK